MSGGGGEDGTKPEAFLVKLLSDFRLSWTETYLLDFFVYDFYLHEVDDLSAKKIHQPSSHTLGISAPWVYLNIMDVSQYLGCQVDCSFVF